MFNTDNDDPTFYDSLYRWSARSSVVALEMVFPAIIGVGLDRLCGTVVLFVILGAVLGMVLGFWQLINIARSVHGIGVDKSPKTEDNKKD